ncbi:MAG TPA: hypothetical protein VGF55_04305 [Gemmataceae bacterium]
MSDVPPESRHLTFTELVFHYGLYGGIGYLAAGQVGLWSGVGLITAAYGRLIWLSAHPPTAAGQPRAGVLGESGAEPDAAADGGRDSGSP